MDQYDYESTKLNELLKGSGWESSVQIQQLSDFPVLLLRKELNGNKSPLEAMAEFSKFLKPRDKLNEQIVKDAESFRSIQTVTKDIISLFS